MADKQLVVVHYILFLAKHFPTIPNDFAIFRKT